MGTKGSMRPHRFTRHKVEPGVRRHLPGGRAVPLSASPTLSGAVSVTLPCVCTPSQTAIAAYAGDDEDDSGDDGVELDDSGDHATQLLRRHTES